MCRGLFSPRLSKIESERRSKVRLIERAGEEELRLGASLSVSPVSMRTCQSIHICIDLLSVPSVQDQTLGRRHTHTDTHVQTEERTQCCAMKSSALTRLIS